jgi:hypothetical protein
MGGSDGFYFSVFQIKCLSDSIRRDLRIHAAQDYAAVWIKAPGHRYFAIALRFQVYCELFSLIFNCFISSFRRKIISELFCGCLSRVAETEFGD